MTIQKPSADQYFELLRLRALGCPVAYEKLPRPAQPLRIDTVGSYINTNLYRVEGGTAFILPVHIYVAAPITVYKYHARLLWFGRRVSWLTPSEKHPNYYLLPPGVWIPRSGVLNQALHPDRPLRTNSHFNGLLLGTIPEDISNYVGQEVPGMLSIEDLLGREYYFPINAVARPLDPAFLHKYGEKATFPPDREQAPTLTANPAVTPTVKDKTETFGWKIITEMFPELDKCPELDAAPTIPMDRSWAASLDRGVLPAEANNLFVMNNPDCHTKLAGLFQNLIIGRKQTEHRAQASALPSQAGAPLESG